MLKVVRLQVAMPTKISQRLVLSIRIRVPALIRAFVACYYSRIRVSTLIRAFVAIIYPRIHGVIPQGKKERKMPEDPSPPASCLFPV